MKPAVPIITVLLSLTAGIALWGSQNGRETDNAKAATDKSSGAVLTPEMFGATGNGTSHRLSEKYKTIADARKDYPGVQDLNITFDGAAFQKAVDTASASGGEVAAEGRYVINSPIVMKDHVVVDGRNKGTLTNDRSRGKMLNWAFLFGDHAPYGFNKAGNNGAGYEFYDVNEPMKIGRDFLTLAHDADASAFKMDQIVMVVSAFKRNQNLSRVMLPYHVTIAKIVKLDGNRIHFEHPFDEDVDSVQICANGNFDSHTGINFGGVQDVTLRNLTIDAAQISGSEYAYKCHIDNIHLIDGVRLVGMNAMAYSTFTNITGTFAWRCIEIKTGSHNLLVKNIRGTCKPIPGFPKVIDAISIGQYNRGVTVDGFDIDFGAAAPRISTVGFRSRKAVISNGVITCTHQTTPFVTFHNEHYLADPRFGCQGNRLTNVKFHGGSRMKFVFEMGDGTAPNKDKRKDNWVTQRKLAHSQSKAARTGEPADPDEMFDAPKTENVYPEGNLVEHCLFQGGGAHSAVSLKGGSGNIIRNCTFPDAHLKAAPAFLSSNELVNNTFRK